MYDYNERAKAVNVDYMEKVMRVTTLEEFKDAVTSGTTENMWEAKLKADTARRKFAVCNNRAIESVTDEELINTSIGIDGWADMTVSANFAVSKAKAKAKAAPKLKDATATPARGGGRGSGGNQISIVEKAAKDMFAEQQHCSMTG